MITSDVAAAAPLATPEPAAAPAPAPAAPAATPPSAPVAEQPFLRVNDRTVYRTQEDALKGWNELNGLAEKARSMDVFFKPTTEGGFGLKDVSQVSELLDKYAEYLFQKQQQTPQGTPAAAALTEEQKRLQQLEARLNGFEQQTQAQQVEAEQAAVKDGTSILESLLKDSNVISDADGNEEDRKILEQVGARIGSQINSASYDQKGNRIPDSVAERFIKGDAAARKKIISDELAVFNSFSERRSRSASATAASAKDAAMSSQPRTIPPAGGAAPADRSRMTPEQKERDRITRLNALFES